MQNLLEQLKKVLVKDEQLADLSLHTVAKIEAGATPNLTIDILEKIAKALGVPVAELFK